MNTIESAQKQLEDAQRLLASAQAQLDALQKSAAVEAPKPWEPKGGKFYVSHNGGVHDVPWTTEADRLAGSEYPTREAAESALPYVVFFRRLCCLAAELNPSGKVGGNFVVRYYHGGWRSRQGIAPRDLDSVFETLQAADRAANIMNRDDWKVPAL